MSLTETPGLLCLSFLRVEGTMVSDILDLVAGNLDTVGRLPQAGSWRRCERWCFVDLLCEV